MDKVSNECIHHPVQLQATVEKQREKWVQFILFCEFSGTQGPGPHTLVTRTVLDASGHCHSE